MTAAAAAASQIDTSSRRWLVAIHEAGHVERARSFDWRVTAVRIIGDGGGTWDEAPLLRERARRRRENGLIHLAGPVADEVLVGATMPADGDYSGHGAAARVLDRAGIAPGCEFDMVAARRLLGSDDEFGDALAATRVAVRARWSTIERVARVLYLRGELDARGVKAAAR